jgi:hypothetical protein
MREELPTVPESRDYPLFRLGLHTGITPWHTVSSQRGHDQTHPPYLPMECRVSYHEPEPLLIRLIAGANRDTWLCTHTAQCGTGTSIHRRPAPLRSTIRPTDDVLIVKYLPPTVATPTFTTPPPVPSLHPDSP